jgi:hypothetical protein
MKNEKLKQGRPWESGLRPAASLQILLLHFAFFISIFLAGCLGGSDGVENPKLTFNGQSDDGSAVTGLRVAIYAKNQDPVRVPELMRLDVSGHKASFSPEDIAFILHAADTVFDFNVVLISGERETFSSGYRLRVSGKRMGFSRVGPDAKPLDGGYGSVVETMVLRKAVQGFSGKVGKVGAALGLDYVFVPGSPYHATVTDSAFTVARMAPGIFDLVGADQDSSKFFRSVDSLNTADTAFTAKSWGEILLLQ